MYSIQYINYVFYPVYKSQQDAHFTKFILYNNCSTCFGGVTITHLQEHKTNITTAFGNRYTILLSAVIVEALELI